MAQWRVKIGPPQQVDKTNGNIGPATFEWVGDDPPDMSGPGVLWSYTFRSIRQTAGGAQAVREKLEAARDAAMNPPVPRPNAMTTAMNEEK